MPDEFDKPSEKKDSNEYGEDAEVLNRYVVFYDQQSHGKFPPVSRLSRWR
jgi:hypothetical protein